MDDLDSADGEADDRAQGCNEHEARVHVQHIGEHGSNSKQQTEHIEPERRANLGREIFAQAELQQERGQTDSRHHYQRQGTEECRARGVDDDNCQGDEQQARGNDGPAARLG